MKIQQSTDSLKMVLGWYGKSNTTPEEFDLRQHTDTIYAVYQFIQSATGAVSFLSSAPDYLNKFNKLEWGKAYLIVIKSGSAELSIPNFVASSFESEGVGTITDQSETTPNDVGRQKDGYFYHSNNKMFKYAVYNGYETYENTKHMESIHRAFDLWEKIAKHPSSTYEHEVGIYFVDLVEEYGSEYADVLAMAGPEEFDKSPQDWQFGNTFPTYSQVIINIPNIEYMLSIKNDDGADLYYSTIVHELAHALALNYYVMNEFTETPVNSYVDSVDNKLKYYYYGDNALREYRNYFSNQSGLIGVPLDDNIPAPRISAHWEEGPGQESVPRYINGILHPGLVTAMMTPYADEGATPLTKITIGFLEDYGYEVDYDYADEYGALYDSLCKLKCNSSCSLYNSKLHDNIKIKRIQ
tara:strand:+ start:186 stop:1418 length:1233 start_codon:yes stop_codon:yes gene_type:complete